MVLTTNALFLLACIGMAWWMKKDPSFRRREFIAVSLFWILFAATAWGGTFFATIHEFIGTGVQTASETVNTVSSN